MKKILFLLFLYSHVFALYIDESLLNIHATLLPKLAFMDSQYKAKLDKDRLSIIIFYSKINYSSAQILQKNIEKKYPHGIKEHPIKLTLLPYRFKQKMQANIYYLMPANEKEIKQVVGLAKEEKILTFSYLEENLAQGSTIALSIGVKVKPILNLSALKECNITIHDVLLKISTIYQKEIY